MYHIERLAGLGKTSRYSGTQNIRGMRLRITYPGASGQYRGIVRATLGGLGCDCVSHGLGDTAQVQSAAGGASQGATAGSAIWPGVGTVIGAVAGAIYGYLKGRKKPMRPSRQDKENCRNVMNDYKNLIEPYPNQAIGGALPEESIKAVWMCDEMINQGTTPNPLYLEGNWLVAKEMAIEAVKKTFTTPAGSTILLTTKGRRDRAGKLFREVNETWVNGEANSMNAIATRLNSFFLKGCLSYHKPGVCDPLNSRPLWRHMVLDLVAWAAATQIPQVQLPSDPNATLPGAPAAAAVPVTAAPPTAPPILLAPGAPVQPVLRQQPMSIPTAQTQSFAPTSFIPAQPGAPAGAYEAGLATQLQPLIAQLIGQGADRNTAFTTALSTLAQRGIEPTAAVQSAVAAQVQSTGAVSPWILVGGGLAVAMLMFSLSGRRS